MSNNIHILVADDDKQLRESLVEHLSTEGYDVVPVGDGNEIPSLIHRKEFDLIVLDLKMPNLNGFEILKFVKKTLPKTKVIVLTAYAYLKNVTECRKLGADDVIEKPCDIGDLFSAIEYVMEK